jgi:hypothetical protein
MDPNETLGQIRAILTDDDDTKSWSSEQLEKMADLFDRLDGWLSSGGVLPDAWRKPTTGVLKYTHVTVHGAPFVVTIDLDRVARDMEYHVMHGTRGEVTRARGAIVARRHREPSAQAVIDAANARGVDTRAKSARTGRKPREV